MRDASTAIIERDGEWIIANSPEAPAASGQGHPVGEAVRADNVTGGPHSGLGSNRRYSALSNDRRRLRTLSLRLIPAPERCR